MLQLKNMFHACTSSVQDIWCQNVTKNRNDIEEHWTITFPCFPNVDIYIRCPSPYSVISFVVFLVFFFTVGSAHENKILNWSPLLTADLFALLSSLHLFPWMQEGLRVFLWHSRSLLSRKFTSIRGLEPKWSDAAVAAGHDSEWGWPWAKL